MPRGAIEVKGKGAMNTFWITGAIPATPFDSLAPAPALAAGGRAASQPQAGNGIGGDSSSWGQNRSAAAAVADWPPIASAAATLTFASIW